MLSFITRITTKESSVSNVSARDLPIITIGAGSVGVHFVQELLKQSTNIPIKVFGGEAELPYKRENLS